jgi:hypothetical protein
VRDGVGIVDVRGPSDESGDTAIGKAEEDQDPWEDTAPVIGGVHLCRMMYALTCQSFEGTPRGGITRLGCNLPQFRVTGGNWLDRHRCTNLLSEEETLKETPKGKCCRGLCNSASNN